MKIYSMLLGALLLGISCLAQKKPVLPEMPDVNKLMKMSPAEREAYKQKLLKQSTATAAEIIENNNLSVDVNSVPGYEIKPPVKDVARLALIPSRPPSRQELVAGIQQSINQVKQGIPAPKMQEIQQYSASLPVTSIHDAAITSFYHGDEKEGMLLLMQAVKDAPDSLQMLNNLGAMFNMIGVPHKAIPLLQYCLEKVPQSATVLNNIGQSFMALGDAMKAAEYLNQCLAVDSLNIEANHSMGMLHLFKKEYAEGMKYFERELSIAIRRSSLAMAYKTGQSFNLRELTRRKHARNGVPVKNSFEEITMGKFSLPNFPTTALEAKLRTGELEAYERSVQAESMHWLNVMNETNRNAPDGNDVYPGIYSDLVDAMMEELHKEFNPTYLSNYSKADAKWVTDRLEMGMQAILKANCPPIPNGASIEAQRAYEMKCCEENKRPLADMLIADLAAYVQALTNVGQQRWKSYINQLVAIAQLDPDASNQAAVYGAVSGYFNYLSWGAHFFTTREVNNLLAGCKDNYRKEQADSIIQSDHNWRMACPAWLNVNIDFGGPSLKADCSKFAVEVGKAWTAGYEHEFTTGKSTFLVGPASKIEFLGGLVKAESKTQAFLTFDKNKEFADFGIKNTMKLGASVSPIRAGSLKLGTNLGSVEMSNSIGINSGFKSDYKVKGWVKIFE